MYSCSWACQLHILDCPAGGNGRSARRAAKQHLDEELAVAGAIGQDVAAFHAPMDTGFKRLLQRLLKAFVSDPRQRDMSFPEILSAADRWKIHVVAEAWGLGHESQGLPPHRTIRVCGSGLTCIGLHMLSNTCMLLLWCCGTLIMYCIV